MADKITPQQRRKNILNSLSSDKSLDLDKEKLMQILETLEISPNSRAENLSLDDYIRISKHL